MNRFLKIVSWMTISFILFAVAGYYAIVQWQYSKLPENRNPATAIYSPRVQKLFWHTAFGPKPMEMNSYPFWKVIMLLPDALAPHGKFPQEFGAAYQAGKFLTKSADSPPPRTIRRAINETFAAIWISTHWTAEETVNTILEKAYFCHEIYGFNSAAQRYYGLDPNKLTDEEIVFLSGISKAPCLYSPWSRPKSALYRGAWSLRNISRMGFVKVSTDPKVCFERLQPPPWPIDTSKNEKD